MELCSQIRIRGYHLDVFGHVNNARFLEFLEEARWELFDRCLGAIDPAQMGLAVVNIDINFRKPILFGDLIDIYAGLRSVGRKSAVIEQEIRIQRNDALAADATVTFVVFDPKTGRAVPLDEGTPHELITKLAREKDAKEGEGVTS